MEQHPANPLGFSEVVLFRHLLVRGIDGPLGDAFRSLTVHFNESLRAWA